MRKYVKPLAGLIDRYRRSITRGRAIRRWKASPGIASEIVHTALSGMDWTALLERMPLLPPHMTQLAPERHPRDLRGIEFADLDLGDGAWLSDTALDWSRFERVEIHGNIVNCSFRGAVFAQLCDLEDTTFEHCDFRDAILAGCNLRNCVFKNCNLLNANLEHSHFGATVFKGVAINRESALAFMGLGHRGTRFGGDYQSPETTTNSDIRVRTALEIVSRVGELRRERRALAVFWYLLANYGESATRLAFWAIVTWVVFGMWFAGFPVPRVLAGTPIEPLLNVGAPTMVSGAGCSVLYRCNPFLPWYFSAVTLTTLGYGDVHPAADCAIGQALVVVEVTLGYIFLGGFVSILLRSSR